MMNSLKERQQQLQARCYHPAGRWEPVDWRAPRQSIPERIAALAREAPDRPAVVDHQTSLTFAQLDQRANEIANAILERKGERQAVVALLLGVGAPSVAAVLGVLKAGQIYVGLEASFPEKRNRQILEDIGASLLLTDDGYLGQAQELAGGRRQVLNLDDRPPAGDEAPPIAIDLEALATLNFTSGSTGRPKGVCHSHRSAFTRSVHSVAFYHIGGGDLCATTITLAWGGSVTMTFGPLCHGGCVGRFDLGRHGLQRLIHWLLDSEATVVAGLATVRQIVHTYPEKRFPAVRLAYVSGDTIFDRDVVACRRVFPNAMIGVGLRLTEAGTTTEFILDSAAMLEQEVVPLGFPAPGVRLKLLNEAGGEVAPGEVGEIVVQSNHLAAGYWRQPELTAAKFRHLDLFGGERAYFTGDLGQITPDGLLHHRGRKDFMVKIRGYQVFINEIEAILLSVAGVREACVMAHTGPAGEKRLVAYLVVEEESFAGMAALHSRFADLPRHMRPQSFVLLDALPRTANGKIDRPRLPLPRQSRLAVTASYVAPRTDTEVVLAEMWGEVLGIDSLGVDDNYLELGGDSLQSTRIIERVVERFGLTLSFAAFFEALTVADMARLLDAGE